jgi:hypothetical protein
MERTYLYIPTYVHIIIRSYADIIKERGSAPPRQVKKVDRATRDIIRDGESSRFQVVVEGQLQIMDFILKHCTPPMQ